MDKERNDPTLPEWEYVPEGWQRQMVDEGITGWASSRVAESYRTKWPSFVQAVGSGLLGIDHEVLAGEPIQNGDLAAHNTLLTFGYVLARVSRNKERISILDWGGATGHYFVVAKVLVPEVTLFYHCREVPEVCAVGRELSPEVRFHEDDTCLRERYDLVLASSSLQYSEHWQQTFRALSSAARDYFYVTRVPISFHAESFVVLQRAYAYGYETEYLSWVINREALLAEAAASNIELVNEFLVTGGFEAKGAPETPVYDRGFLFRNRLSSRKHASA
jgi:putative methyltransferase (TIGR04325 family)